MSGFMGTMTTAGLKYNEKVTVISGTWQLDVCSCRVQADEGFKLEVMQVVPLQRENGQTIERSQSIAVNLRDVVVTQLQHLDRQTGNKTDRQTSHLAHKRIDFNSG